MTKGEEHVSERVSRRATGPPFSPIYLRRIVHSTLSDKKMGIIRVSTECGGERCMACGA